MDLKQFLEEIIKAFLALIVGATILKSINILMKGQADGVGVKESLQKVKRVIKAAIVCLAITSVIAILQGYF